MTGATTPLAHHIDALLPQTQCTRCGYPTCRDYAEAIANGAADIDRCPPGGADGIAALAGLLGRAPKPLDPSCGVEAAPVVARIDENVCIGCTKCIRACPVDAIVGAAKRMHTVIAGECTGCGLCLPPCPVDCIELVPVAGEPLARADVLARAARSKARFDDRNTRLLRAGREKSGRSHAGDAAPVHPEPAPSPRPGGTAIAGTASTPISRSAVLEAIARGRARKLEGR